MLISEMGLYISILSVIILASSVGNLPRSHYPYKMSRAAMALCFYFLKLCRIGTTLVARKFGGSNQCRFGFLV